jgi:hypothetical protein
MRFNRLSRVLAGVALATALGAGLASAAAAQTPAPSVKVFVDGSPVYFDVAPVIANGRVLVPLRGVFERLGATVAWDPTSQTVLAQNGATSVSLRIGSPQAFVNGQPQVLDVPAMLMGGRTLVPLRFISQALGAAVTWDAATSTVQITSQAAVAPAPPAVSVPPSVSYGPPPPVYQTPQAISGTVIQVDASVYPGQLTIQTANGAVYAYQVVSGTAITRTNTATGVSGPIALSAIAPGDAVTVTADQTGIAQTVQDVYTVVSGTIGSVGDNRVVLQSGQTYSLSPVVRVVRGGVSTSAAALQPGDVVTLRLNPTTGQVYGIAVRQPGANVGPITSVSVTPNGRPLGPGDVMQVVVTGPARGIATFTITGLRSGLPMRESATQPGTYIGTYAIQPGDNVANTTVVVSIRAPGGQLLTATAPSLVSIEGSAIVPPAVGGAPVIVSPAPGSGIVTPFTVTGTAPPGSLVKVTADYGGNVLLFNVHGTLGTQTVQADPNGNWSATFTQASPVRNVTVTISAVLVDYNGTARSPATQINTTLQ